jgi:hypothetical protein
MQAPPALFSDRLIAHQIVGPLLTRPCAECIEALRGLDFLAAPN